MRKVYETPAAEMLLLSAKDIITTSPGLNVDPEQGTSGGEVDFGGVTASPEE